MQNEEDKNKVEIKNSYKVGEYYADETAQLEKEELFHNKIDILVSNYQKISQYAGFKNIHCRKFSNPKYRTKFAKSNVNKTEEMTPVERLLQNFVPVKDFSKQLKITNVQNFVRDIDLSLTSN